jgi:hypothetical protein
MYTFNLFCFGHQLSKNPELNNLLNEYDLEFHTTINGKRFEVDFPYHGGQCRGDVYSCVFGTIITDDDQNIMYVDTIRNAKESDYLDDYNQFLDQLFKGLDDDIQNCGIHEKEEFKNIVTKLKDFIANNEPEFYCVEASS